MSLTASGLVGERLVFSLRKTGQQARIQKSNTDLNSFSQNRNRDVYRDAVAEWNLLTTAEKNDWKALAAGQNLTGYNLFMQDYYMNTIRKLATVENIDFGVVAETPLYTVPTGTKLIVFGMTMTTKTYDTIANDGSAFLMDSEGVKTSMCIHSYELGDVGHLSLCLNDLSQTGLAWVFLANEVVMFNVDIADTGTALSLDVDLLGYLIEA